MLCILILNKQLTGNLLFECLLCTDEQIYSSNEYMVVAKQLVGILQYTWIGIGVPACHR